jgi:hypothetical protein
MPQREEIPMDDDRHGGRKVRSLTVAALLGIFVVAVVLAIAGRLVPGGFSRMVAEARARAAARSGNGRTDD